MWDQTTMNWDVPALALLLTPGMLIKALYEGLEQVCSNLNWKFRKVILDEV